MRNMVRKTCVVLALMGSSYFCGVVYAESHIDTSITLLKSAIKEAVMCGGGGTDGSGCTGPRGEAIRLMNRSLDLLYQAR